MQFIICLRYVQQLLKHDANQHEVYNLLTLALPFVRHNLNTIYYAICLFEKYKKAMTSKYGQQDHVSRGNLLQFAIMIVIAVKMQEDVCFNAEDSMLYYLQHSTDRFCWIDRNIVCSMEWAICSFLEYCTFVSDTEYKECKRTVKKWYMRNEKRSSV